MKRAFKPTDIPDGPHIAVIVFDTSTKNEWQDEYTPGRGGGQYVSTTVTSQEYWVGENEADLCTWLQAVRSEGLSRRSYTILQVAGQFEVETKVSLKKRADNDERSTRDFSHRVR